jgi:hypothetical protein
MRYVINDDDLEDWKTRLQRLSLKVLDPDLDYVIGQLEMYINHPLAFNENEKQAQENQRLRTMLFHFTGKME